MTRLVIISDTHGNSDLMLKVIKRHPDAKYYFHLGDGASEFISLKKSLKLKNCIAVKGNCDSGSLKLPEFCLKRVGGKKVFAAHGNGLNVKTGIDDIVSYAKKKKADIILYGHTHKKLTKFYNNTYILNPGSLLLPKDDCPSYGIVDITEDGVVLNLVEFNG